MSSFDSIWGRYRALHHRNLYVTPGLAALFFLAFLELDLRINPAPDAASEQENALGVLLGLAQVLPLVFVRKAPLATLMVIFAALVAHSVLDYQGLWVAQFTTLIGLYQVTSTTGNRQSFFAGVVSFGVIVTIFVIIRPDPDAVIALTVLFAAVWIAGNVIRWRRARLEIAELTVAELSDEQARATREATNEERARIARELHDIVGHALNLVVIQAGAAQRVFEASPEKALEAMKSVESNGRQALSDVDRMLGILRDSEDTAASTHSLEARPSMSRLGSLVDELGATGQPVDLKVSGTPARLAPSIDLSAYRVVQEALTNVMKHAAGAKARVDVEYSEALLSITVRNDSSGAEGVTGRSGTGRGIVGMRERTALFRGAFEAGSTDDGGWRVHATFPIGPVSPSGGLK